MSGEQNDKELKIPSVKLSSQNLAKQIFNAELPEQFIRTIPAQSLYTAVKRNGLESSTDLIEIATVEQCRLMLDFDLWQKWEFKEDNFWNWLALTDEGDGLVLLQKLVKVVDLKLVALMISRYVDSVTFDDPSSQPPGAGYFTPDQGYTWIFIDIEDSSRHFHFGRFLALIFETNADLFYQLLAIPGNATESGLEEESYNDKTKRLLSEGIPDADGAASLNTAASRAEISKLLESKASHDQMIDIRPVEPLIYDSHSLKPLNQLFEDLNIREDIETEFTFILNSAIVFWTSEFYNYEKVVHLVSKVKGAVNIGLMEAAQMSSLTIPEIYKILGIKKLYQLGLLVLKELRLSVVKLEKNTDKNSVVEPDKLAVIELAKMNFPEIPEFLKENQDLQDALRLSTIAKPFEHLEEIQKVKTFLSI